MSDYLCIKNRGEIDINAIILLGASTKRGDSSGKFGFFGTGAPYAAATLLRNGAEIIVYSGKDRINIVAEDCSFRDKNFKRIVLIKNGERFPTSFTTELGPTWEVYMGIREYVCNAKDEGGDSVFVVDDGWINNLGAGKVGEDIRIGNTHILISYETVREVWENWKNYFRFGEEPIERVENIGAVYPHLADGRGRVYKRGVLVYLYPEKDRTLFDYDLEGVSWGEDRRSNQYDIQYPMFRLIDNLSKGMKKEILFNMCDNTKEAQAVSEWESLNREYSEILKDTLVLTSAQLMLYSEEIAGKDYIRVSDNWCSYLKRDENIKTVDKIFGRNSAGGYKVVSRTELENKYLKEAKKFFRGTGFDIDLDIIDIAVVSNKKLNTWLGMVDNDRVVINRDTFNKGLKEVVRCLVEEFCHLRSGACDKSRKFQDVLIDSLVNVLINKSKKVL